MAERSEAKDATAAGTPGRKPYEKPAVAWEEALEDRPNLMAACAQHPGESDACNAEPTS